MKWRIAHKKIKYAREETRQNEKQRNRRKRSDVDDGKKVGRKEMAQPAEVD